MKKTFLLLLLASAVAGGSYIDFSTQPFAVPQGWAMPVYDFSKNPLDTAKITLGRVLFYDDILSRDGTISCASCHSPFNAFTHVDHDLSHGINDQIGTRNAPALMNLAWHGLFMWDGAINHLDMQALAPISHPKEMGESIENICNKLQSSPRYKSLFYRAFGDSLATGEQVLKALSQFQLTLLSANAKYDSVMRQEAVFTEQEARGYALFRQHCNSCHTEPLFSNYAFANNGLPVDTSLNDYGRMTMTQNAQDSLKFKTPSLRNIAFTFPYMHDGRFKKLSQVLNHYSQGVQKSPTLAPELKNGINLTSNEKVDIIAFLLTLSDKSFVFNPNFSFPKHILNP